VLHTGYAALTPAKEDEGNRISLPLGTSWFGRIRRTILGLSKQIAGPPSPARGHPGNHKQPFDFIAIAGVDAKYISDGEIMIGSLDYPDLISRPHITLDNYSEVGSRSQRLGEAARKHLVVHPNSEPPARYSRLGSLKNNGSDLPTLSDEHIVHLNPFFVRFSPNSPYARDRPISSSHHRASSVAYA